MNVGQLMSKVVKTCHPDDTVDRAVRTMWERDCGALPIVDDGMRPVGMITDRDVCMAVHTQGKLPRNISIATVGLKPVVTVREEDSAQRAEALMQKHQVRRLAVVDESERLVGILSYRPRAEIRARAGECAQ